MFWWTKNKKHTSYSGISLIFQSFRRTELPKWRILLDEITDMRVKSKMAETPYNLVSWHQAWTLTFWAVSTRNYVITIKTTQRKKIRRKSSRNKNKLHLNFMLPNDFSDVILAKIAASSCSDIFTQQNKNECEKIEAEVKVHVLLVCVLHETSKMEHSIKLCADCLYPTAVAFARRLFFVEWTIWIFSCQIIITEHAIKVSNL